MKRTVMTIKGFDYENEEDFKKDIPLMKEKGYNLITSEFNNVFSHGEIAHTPDAYRWHYTAYFYKDSLL
jgi:hypothetical protein